VQRNILQAVGVVTTESAPSFRSTLETCSYWAVQADVTCTLIRCVWQVTLRHRTRQTETDFQTHTDMGTHRYTRIHKHTDTERRIHTHRHTQTHTDTHTHRHIQTHRHTHTHTHTHRHIHRHRHTQIQTHKDTCPSPHVRRCISDISISIQQKHH
jgi:hypothetical protein